MPLFTPEPKHYNNFPKKKKIIILKLVRKYKSVIIFFVSLLAITFITFALFRA